MKYNTYSQNLKIAVFDIETLGLDSSRNSIISASFCDEDGQGLRQYFADNIDSEFLLITKIIDELKSLDAIITYNGIKFDFPFLINRAKKYGLEKDIPSIWNIDIYVYLKKYWEAGKLLPSLSQKNVEYTLGLTENRTDEIDGSECISLYNRFSAYNDIKAKELILLHNADDVKQLAKISNKLSFLNFHKIVYESGYRFKTRLSYPGAEDVTVKIKPVNERNDFFSVDIQTKKGMLPLSVYDEYFTLEYDSFSGIGRLEIRPKQLENYLYVDLTKMPVNISDFDNLDGFASNYLIIKQDDKIYYKEINKLITELSGKIVYE